MHTNWAHQLRDQCAAARVPFFFKKWGTYKPRTKCLPSLPDDITVWPDGSTGDGNVNDLDGFGWPVQRVGKKRAGRLLDGIEHKEFPEALD